MGLFEDFDLSSYDFVNNIDGVFSREMLGAAYVTYAANMLINLAIQVFTKDPLTRLIIWTIVFIASLLIFAYWSSIVGGVKARLFG